MLLLTNGRLFDYGRLYTRCDLDWCYLDGGRHGGFVRRCLLLAGSSGRLLATHGLEIDRSGTLGSGAGSLLREPLANRCSQARQHGGHMVLDFDALSLALGQDRFAVDVQFLGQLVYSQLLSQPISLRKWLALSPAGYSGSFS